MADNPNKQTQDNTLDTTLQDLESPVEIILDDSEIIDELKYSKTLEGNSFVYKDADISITDFDPEVLCPTALYVLRDRVTSLKELYYRFLEKGVDILS
ncbi:MAG: hypothetical protein Q9M91_08460 [Candidatus Dojkabacteria bacterium]|nr:hypothetical protein [Candidatus Dojkabacteria bacterium]MDQ7021804.1 hypothetical protein [Candidatus Dojkabacteria bacterium]